MDTLWQDVGYAARLLRKSPAFTITAVLTLALGIGANTAVFSIVNAVMLRPLPVPHGNRLAVVAVKHPSNTELHGVSYLDLQDYRRSTHSFEDLAGYAPDLVGLRTTNGDARPDRIVISYVTGNYFAALGIQPAAGRLFGPDEGQVAGADPVAVLGHHFWERRFGSDPNVVGQGVTINGKPFTIIGVAPRDFTGTYAIVDMDAYVPFSMRRSERGDVFTHRDEHALHVFGRLKPGVTLKQADADVAVVTAQLAQQYPDTNKGVESAVLSEMLARPEESAASSSPVAGGVFLALVALVLIVASVNVTNIVLARASAREKEIALRAALGAGRGRIVRQLLTESLLLAAIGGVAGVLVGFWASRLLAAIRLPGDLPIRFDFHLDVRVLLYALAVSAASGILIGVAPAMRVWRSDLNDTLREGGRSGESGSRQRIRSALVVGQIALSLVLLVAAGLFVRSMGSAEQVDLGFRAEGLFNASMDVGQLGYDEARGRALYRELDRRIAALPGIESSTQAFSVPLGYYSVSDYLDVQGRPTRQEARPAAGYNAVEPSYFATLGVRILRGRGFADADDERAPRVAVINERMANVLWKGEDPIGRRFSYRGPQGPWIEVVGIARQGKYGFLFEDPQLYFYVPIAQQYMPQRVLHVRANASAPQLASMIERAVHELDPDVVLFDVQPMTNALGGGNGFFLVRMGAIFASALGLLGFALAVIGVYGVISYVASRRTHELGVRMALGAAPTDILRLVLRGGLFLVVLGLAVGVAAALALSRVLANFLFGVSAQDPLTFVTVAAALAGTAVIACAIPAWRAARLDPTVALRGE